MKNILVISNLSYDNEQLIEYAAKFCKHYKHKLHILHIFKDQTSVLTTTPQYYKDSNLHSKADPSKIITQKFRGLTSDLLDPDFLQIKIKRGSYDDILRAFVVENRIDLIIIGATDLDSKSEFIKHRILLINILSTPLMIVPQFQIFKPLSSLNFLTTHTKKDGENIITVSDLFPKSKIVLTHLSSDSDAESNAINAKKWFEFVKDKIGSRITYENIDADLKNYVSDENQINDKKTKGFVFTTHKRNFWSRLMDPSTTLSFLSNLEIPSIIFKIDR